ncbi:hypothetical protein GCM10022215_24780 [Nocardioides fonticola]|uniref:VTT domain-containing protein n=2 Tax=Nocardioides fonticola TaxID=450363 RepID=A0ABP7XKR4_9ACTN
MEDLGSPGAGLAIALENLFPPLPSEVILPLAGFTAARGTFGVVEVLIWTTLGSLVGAVVLHRLGWALGRERMLRIVERMPLVKAEEVVRAEAWFARHGDKAVFYGRMIPLFRSFISVPAGVERMPLPRFMLLTTAGSAIWNTVFVLAGYHLGENWHVVETYAGVLQLVVLGVVAGAAVWWVTARVRAARGATPST